MDTAYQLSQEGGNEDASAELIVGSNLRNLRTRRGYSLRALANSSGLNANTLSLIENGKVSPSVGTLQQLASTLRVPIADFFEAPSLDKRVVFTPANARPRRSLGKTVVESLGKNLAGSRVQPFLVTLKPGSGSGEDTVVHTGHEFVYGLAGEIQYRVDDDEFLLKAGDSLVFEAHLPHAWANQSEDAAQFLLVLYPSNDQEELGGRHFSIDTIKKEISMKIAAITEDGKTISQHFGRAPYYLVLTIEDGKIVDREMRDKIGHSHFQHQAHEGHGHQAGHGMDASSHGKHIQMAKTIEDCKALLCGGMGRGAYESMRQLNIQPVVTDLSDIEAAAQAFIDGKLIDHTELLH